MSDRRTELENAFRQAARAAKQRDHAAADRWTKTAERLANALDAQDAAQTSKAEAQRLAQEQAEQMVCDLFTKVACLANAMVHAPAQAPAAFQGLIKLWREQNLGEGEADAEKAAAKLAASQAAWLDGDFEATLPDFVRERMDADWAARRAELANEPTIPQHWAEAAEAPG